ncbi:MAG: hypothetical protein J7K21_04930 [Desulfurococcales archaeon]|nr:hypothetical protein [Desulfurococcales archaeon]
MSIATYKGSFGGPLGWLARLFRGRKSDKSPALIKTLHLLNKMIEDIEVTRKRMEDRYNDLAKKARDAALHGDKDNHNIFINEMEEISKFIALVIHAKKSMMQIKLRLETMLEMGDTLDQLPEIMTELTNLKPLLARITPELVDRMVELEKQVVSIMSATSIPPVYGKAKPSNHVKTSATTLNVKELMPPKTVPQPKAVAIARNVNKVSLSTIKKWLLEEIMITSGFLDIDAFTRKYGVTKQIVLEALNELHEEGRIIIKR